MRERFWSKVEQRDGPLETPCQVWIAAKTDQGYGQIRVDGKLLYAHRLAYLWRHGAVPPRVDHRCHNRACVADDHLRSATAKQNNENPAGLRSDNKSGIRGVSWLSRLGKWRANVGHNGKQIHVGLFHDIREAELAVIAKRNELFTHNDADRR